ncbi:MAG: hypothetical protein ACYDA1_07185 [Vulcanimicrobiaceae bacterium]
MSKFFDFFKLSPSSDNIAFYTAVSKGTLKIGIILGVWFLLANYVMHIDASLPRTLLEWSAVAYFFCVIVRAILNAALKNKNSSF